jgi:hypothetical protein
MASPHSSISRLLLATAGALVLASQAHTATATAISCPAPNDPPVALPAGAVTVTLDLSSQDQVCLLQRVTTKTITTDEGDATGIISKAFAPAGRSYNGRAWESVAGPYTTAITFTCNDSESCTATLPALDSSEADQEFVLVAQEHTASPQEEVARFLEQATFGPTRELLSNWNFDESLEEWVADQINMDTMTEHRQYFRARANARATGLQDSKTALADKACKANSRWRQYAFGWEEHEYEQVLRLESISDDTFLIKIDGVPRTEVLKAPYTDHGFVPGQDYRVVGYSGGNVGGTLHVRNGRHWKLIEGGNPPIQFTLTQPTTNIDLASALVMVEGGVADGGGEALLGHDLSGQQAVCDSLPAQGGVPVHGQTSDGTWYLHDPRIALKSNTLDSVLVDGGGSAMTSSGGVTQCANAPRTFLNQDTCHVSPTNVNDACAGHYWGYNVANGTHVVVCGSPGEIPNDPTLPSEFDFGLDNSVDRTGTTNDFEIQRETVWTTIALYGEDQLRQRMAWALSQILTMVVKDVDAEDETEPFLVFYDILVRHAFGNYRDILKEVAYSPIMAEMLTYYRNKSMKYAQDRESSSNVFPDENFAREVLQLFSVGLNQMNMDGTLVVDETTGENPFTYDNDDIMDGARAWTGLDRQQTRANIEDLRYEANRIDPMTLVPAWHDPYPKMGLDGNYIGEGIPLCVDAPDQQFLKVGATYRSLGSKSLPELQDDNPDWADDPDIVRVVLTSGSALYQKLCNNGGSGGSCDLTRMQVTLASNLECDSTNIGSLECLIDQPRVVELEGQNLFFEYVRPACVQFPFYNNALKIKGRDRVTKMTMCGDPRLAVAGETCCDAGKDYLSYGKRACAYTGERVAFATNIARCEARDGMQACTWERQSYIRTSDGVVRGDCGRENNSCCSYRENYFWSNAPCTISAKINPEDGKVAIVHNHTDWVSQFSLCSSSYCI